jgi:hypothetical protein
MRRLFLMLVVGMLACSWASTPPAATLPPTFGAETSPPQPTLLAITPTAKTTPAPFPPNATVFPDPSAYQWVELISGLIRPVDIHYKQNGFLYVNYTGSGGNTVIARFQVTSNPNQADPNSEKRLLGVDQPFPNHNGGVVTFGPDGYLYLGLGDGGSQGDPNGNGQNTNLLLGKILRIDVEHGDPYTIPSTNPFGNEIWHYGLRNPWRISFDRATGDLFIADVGQDKWEEIDFVPAGLGGLNFGWNLFEGNHAYAGGSETGITMPVAEYDHSQGCAVTGGYVYRGSMPEWQGIYLYGDYCSGLVWGLAHTAQSWQNRLLFETGFNISTFGEDESGEIYLADLRGSIYRLEAK